MKPYDIRRKIELTRRYTAAAATAEEKEAAVSKAHDYVMLGYTLLNAADIVLRRTEDIMSKVDSRYRYDDHFRIRESLKELRRDYIGYELEDRYYRIAEKRLHEVQGIIL